jgi:hypothetical protein
MTSRGKGDDEEGLTTRKLSKFVREKVSNEQKVSSNMEASHDGNGRWNEMSIQRKITWRVILSRRGRAGSSKWGWNGSAESAKETSTQSCRSKNSH